MKATNPRSVFVIVVVALVSMVALAQTLPKPTSESDYPPIPVIPPYIHMADSFQVFSITAP